MLMDAARSSAQQRTAAHRLIYTPGDLSRTGRDGTNPGRCDVSTSPPWDNRAVIIENIGITPTMGHSGSLVVLNKCQFTSPSISRNTQKFDASVDGNLADDGYSTSIFIKVLGQ